ncbi:COX15/CtaA family protein [Neobacillus kokaensis]|uniref:Heme A synthase n=1 Tax=Neobacillus kokaensis TaxID=2759023 RepID=A0ABQ3N930_9BACI|nr:COX15/CtaA family protein [Neobacillus kokaensis]GHI00702.1 heme A synthase [Neobacillus kokaensis]
MTIKRLAFICIVLTYFLIVFGGYVASSESGMGCGPEWPLCNGEVIPTLQGETLIEFMHRIIGALLGGLSILLFFKLMREKMGYTARFVSVMMIGLLIIQVLLGAVVVVLDLPSIIISIHLLVAFVFLACLIWLWRYSGEERITQMTLKAADHGRIIKHVNNLLILLLLTLAFGAYIKHETYGLACGWFGCRQTFLPSTTPELLQTIHRGLAVISTIYIILLTYWAFSKKWGRNLQRRFLLCSLLVLFQLVIGTFVIESFIAIPWAVVHLAIAAALFAFISEARVYAGGRVMQSLASGSLIGECTESRIGEV